MYQFNNDHWSFPSTSSLASASALASITHPLHPNTARSARLWQVAVSQRPGKTNIKYPSLLKKNFTFDR